MMTASVKAATSARVRVGEPEHDAATDFLYEEAHLLEEGLFEDWLALLDPGIRYSAPVRRTRLRHEGSEFDPAMKHFEDDLGSLHLRVKRLRTRYAYAEDPPSRTRRLVTNIRVHRAEEALEVSSSLLVLRNRLDEPTAHLLAARRDDLLVAGPDRGLLLRRRTVLLDSSTLPTHNLAIFL
jgi:3-phenylpropionate/cinnamic acid dioxygenase small subunit